MRADADLVERAVVFRVAVMSAGSDAAFDALVRGAVIKVHVHDLLLDFQT